MPTTSKAGTVNGADKGKEIDAQLSKFFDEVKQSVKELKDVGDSTHMRQQDEWLGSFYYYLSLMRGTFKFAKMSLENSETFNSEKDLKKYIEGKVKEILQEDTKT